MLVILNSLSLAVAIVVYGFIGFGEAGTKEESLFTPAGYVFSIWGIIFLMLILFNVFQWTSLLKSKDYEVIDSTNMLFMVSNLAVTAWMILWNKTYTSYAIIAMFVLLIVLILLVIRLRMEIWDAPLRIIGFVWWPFAIYVGWMIMETIIRTAAFLSLMEWGIFENHQRLWTIVMIIVATIIYLTAIFTRNLREVAAVGIWGLAGLVARHGDNLPGITLVASAGAVILFAAILYHGYKNRATSPFNKFRRGEF